MSDILRAGGWGTPGDAAHIRAVIDQVQGGVVSTSGTARMGMTSVAPTTSFRAPIGTLAGPDWGPFIRDQIDTIIGGVFGGGASPRASSKTGDPSGTSH